jgi:hypothetical protein
MGSGNAATNAATAANAQTQQQIAGSVNAINNAYNSPARAQQTAQYGTSLQNYYTNQVNQQQTVNARDLMFSNARSGLTGGSAATDSNTQLGKDYTAGLLTASQQAQGGQAALENSDINAKNQLIGLAEQGDTTGNIGTSIASAQDASLKAAGNYGAANSLGTVFAGTAGIYGAEQTAAANRAAQRAPIGSLYGGTTGSSIYG